MPAELYIFAFFLIAYGTMITIAIIGFNHLKRRFQLKTENYPFISIVISARNESNTIAESLSQIAKQSYSKELYEVILVDDCSSDQTAQIAEASLQRSRINLTLIRQDTHRGKKFNLNAAIEKSRGTVIITADADVTYRHPNWLQTIASYFNAHSPDLLIMPIDFENNSGILESFQIVENLALTGFTGGFCGINKPFLCNGANLAFQKEAFQRVRGYHDHLHLSSGEDIFLMEAIKSLNPHSIHYGLIRELIVKTPAVHSFKDLFRQRLRWANKAKSNPNHFNLFAGFVIMGANLIFIALCVAIIRDSPLVPYLSIFAVSKFIFDFLLLFLAAEFLGRVKFVWWIFPFECVYWIYTLIVGIGSLIYKPYWKGIKTT